MLTEMNKAIIENPAFDAWNQGERRPAAVGKPEAIGAALFLASAASSYVNGQIIYVDGGARRALTAARFAADVPPLVAIACTRPLAQRARAAASCCAGFAAPSCSRLDRLGADAQQLAQVGRGQIHAGARCSLAEKPRMAGRRRDRTGTLPPGQRLHLPLELADPALQRRDFALLRWPWSITCCRPLRARRVISCFSGADIAISCFQVLRRQRCRGVTRIQQAAPRVRQRSAGRARLACPMPMRAYPLGVGERVLASGVAHGVHGDEPDARAAWAGSFSTPPRAGVAALHAAIARAALQHHDPRDARGGTRWPTTASSSAPIVHATLRQAPATLRMHSLPFLFCRRP
jgi:hypothetical protein